MVGPSALLFARVCEVVFPNGIKGFFLCSIPLNAVFRQGRHGVGWGGDVNVHVNLRHMHNLLGYHPRDFADITKDKAWLEV